MGEAKSDIALDLDALAPANIQIKFNGEIIRVIPPTLEQYAKLIDFAESMKSLENRPNANQDIMGAYKDIKEFIYECIPDLEDKPLNVAQITSLFELLSTMGAPSDKVVEKLKEKGITVKTEGNKDPKVPAS